MSFPPIPEPNENNLLEVVQIQKQIIEILLGLRGENDDAAVTELRLYTVFKAFGLNVNTGAMRQGTSAANADATPNQLWADSSDNYTVKRAQ